MSANTFIDATSADFHAAFLDAGLATLGIYTAPGGEPSARRAYVDDALQTQSEYGQVIGSRTVITFLLVDGDVVSDATFVVGLKTYTLDRIDGSDLDNGIEQRWVVRNG